MYLLVNHLYTHVLFDLGATHSFINLELAENLACDLEEMDMQLCNFPRRLRLSYQYYF